MGKNKRLIDDEILDVEGVAELMKVKPLTVREWAKKGQIPAYKMGRQWRFSKAKIIKQIQEGNSNE